MSRLLKTPLEKAQGTDEAAQQRLAGFRAELATMEARLAGETDFDAGFALREDIERQKRKIAAAEVAAAEATKQLGAEQARLVAAEKRGKVEAYRKAAEKEFAPLTAEILRDCAALKRKIVKLAGHVEQAPEFQRLARELGLPVPSDGELLMRGTPGREIPAVTRVERAFVNAAGERPNQLVERGGKMVPLENGYGPQGPFAERDVEVVQSPARYVPPQMPDRLSNLARHLP